VLRKELEFLASDKLPTLAGLVREGHANGPADRSDPRRGQSDHRSPRTSATSGRSCSSAQLRRLATEAREALLPATSKAFNAKRKELLTNEVMRRDRRQQSIDDALDEFKKVFRKDEQLSKTRDLDLVNAARAILASSFGIGKSDKPASPISNR
jgi:hypothetical protein